MILLNGDCLKLMPTLETNSIDFVLVDLPYGTTKCKWDSEIDLVEMWIELKRICKAKANIAFFTTTKFGYQLIKSNEKWFRYDLVWCKQNISGFLSANRAVLRQHEMVYVFGNPNYNSKTYNPQMSIGLPYDKKKNLSSCGLYGENQRQPYNCVDGLRYPTSILKFNRDKVHYHNTQKPVALCEWLIKTYSNEGETVLDFTMGSGSTGVACLNTNRTFIGIEKDEEIFNIAEMRLNDPISLIPKKTGRLVILNP